MATANPTKIPNSENEIQQNFVTKRVFSGLNPRRKQEDGESNITNKRKVRIIYSDPDATDSSSDEEDGAPPPAGPKRRVIEVSYGEVKIPPFQENSIQPAKSENSPKKSKNPRGVSSRNASNKLPKGDLSGNSDKKYPGVRRRKWGKYCAEVRNPLTGKRLWLGTFDTAEAASKVYEAKKLELQKLREAKLGVRFKAPKVEELSNESTLSNEANPNSCVNCGNEESKGKGVAKKNGSLVIKLKIKGLDLFGCELARGNQGSVLAN